MGGNGGCGYEGSFVLHLERGRVHGRSQCESLVLFRDHTHQLRCRHTHCQPARESLIIVIIIIEHE